MNFFQRLFHSHSFAVKDIMDLDHDPICTCGKTLTECIKEKKYPSFEEMAVVRRLRKPQLDKIKKQRGL